MALPPQIDQAIGHLRESGQLAQLRKRYSTTDQTLSRQHHTGTSPCDF
jgi:hypothetical protein